MLSYLVYKRQRTFSIRNVILTIKITHSREIPWRPRSVDSLGKLVDIHPEVEVEHVVDVHRLEIVNRVPQDREVEANGQQLLHLHEIPPRVEGVGIEIQTSPWTLLHLSCLQAKQRASNYYL